MVVLGIHTRTSAIVHCQWSRSFASEYSCLLYYTLTPALSVCVCMLKYSIMSLEMYVCVRECQVHCGLMCMGVIALAQQGICTCMALNIGIFT